MVVVTVSMRVMSAGDGYRYLLSSVAAGDGDRDLSTPLTRYYAEKGTPPGRWIGSAVADLGGGELAPGDVVTEQQLGLLLGTGHDPITGEPLGRAFPTFAARSERIQARLAALDPDLPADERAAAAAAIEAEETARGRRRAVAGYDYTFSVPKSVSALWAVADPDTQTELVDAHHAAVADVIALMERDVAATRIGSAAHDGAVAQVEVAGLVGTAFDHYDSRAGDPQLHTHVVVSNKVRTVRDGRWRALDGRPMHAAVVALSEHYNALLADRLTRRLGLGWEQRGRGRDRNPAWELAAVPDKLVAAFSSRSRDIDAATAQLINTYVTEHGRRPSAKTVIRLRAQATLATRPDKQQRSLGELTAVWRAQASRVLGVDATTWAARIRAHTSTESVLRVDDVPRAAVTELGDVVVAAVGDRRSTWRYWNLHAEASRQLMGMRFATTEDRDAVVGMVVDAAARASLVLTPPELVSSPVGFRRADGSSVFRPRHAVVYSSTGLLAAEDRLLQLADTMTGPTADTTVATATTRQRHHLWRGQVVGEDQARAVAAVASSARVVDLLVGPAGSGKTTAMHALRTVWEQAHGNGSVIGLAPSAAAAQVLADDLAIPTENTAKWLHDHATGKVAFRPGQLVIVDEASLAGTHTLDTLTTHVAEAGAKLVLAGDPHQLDAVDAGGAFRLLVHARSDVAELGQVYRFGHDWEKHASLRLRAGDITVIDTYLEHDRIRDGDAEQMLDHAYNAWRADVAAGRQAVLIADTRDLVTTLNVRARLDRIVAGQVTGTWPVRLHDHTEASAGDVIVTRRNDRRLTTGRGWVRNGDRWIVTATDRDGSLTVRRLRHRLGRFGARVVLPARYVADHVELGYAVTTHQAEGITVDTAHAIVQSSTTRENLYVAMTRGRHTNIAYVVTDKTDLEDHQQPPGDENVTGASVLYGVLRHVGAELSAHETIEAEQDRWTGIAQLAAEYETIAAAAQHDRWTTLIHHCGLPPTDVEAVLSSEAFGPLTAALRRAEAHGYDVDTLLPRLATVRPLDDAEDIAAVLHHRITRSTTRHGAGSRARLIAGLIPQAAGPMTADMREALEQRRDLIEARATALAETAIADGEDWTRALGVPPGDPRVRRAWFGHVRVVSAYRDRYQITTTNPIGLTVESTSQRADATLARAAIHAAREIAATAVRGEAGSVGRTPPDGSVHHSL